MGGVDAACGGVSSSPRAKTCSSAAAFALGFEVQRRRPGDRLYEHLEPGGTLVLDNEVPYAGTGSHWWQYWPTEKRQELPRPWRDEGDRRIGADGTEYELNSRIADVDALAQRVTLELRATMSRDGELLAEEDYVLPMTMYFTHELELMLERTGFVDIQVRAALSDREPTSDDDFVVFIARKP